MDVSYLSRSHTTSNKVSTTGVELSLTRRGCGGSQGGTTGPTGKSSCIPPKAFTSFVVSLSAVKCLWAESPSGLLLCYYGMNNNKTN